MKIWHWFAVSLLALASAGVQAATSLTFNGTNDNTDGFGTGSVLYDGETQLIFHNGTAGDTFDDPWILKVDAGSAGAVGSFHDVELNISPFLNVNIVDMMITSSSAGLLINGSGDSWSIQATAPGIYTFNVMGSLGPGVTGGVYSVGLTTTVAPVPIPPAALLFGSALVGFAALRRKRATTSESV